MDDVIPVFVNFYRGVDHGPHLRLVGGVDLVALHLARIDAREGSVVVSDRDISVQMSVGRSAGLSFRKARRFHGYVVIARAVSLPASGTRFVGEPSVMDPSAFRVQPAGSAPQATSRRSPRARQGNSRWQSRPLCCIRGRSRRPGNRFRRCPTWR